MSMIQVSEELVAQFLGSKTRRSDAYIRRSRGISRNVLPSILLLTVYDTRYSGHDMPPFARSPYSSIFAVRLRNPKWATYDRNRASVTYPSLA